VIIRSVGESTVGCPLRGGRGKCKIIGTSVPPKTIKKKKRSLSSL
jgi:hypothetical protein